MKKKFILPNLKTDFIFSFLKLRMSFILSKLKIKAGFTLLESMIVLMLFVSAIVISSQVYLSLMRSAILAQNAQLGLDNFRFGVEKIWNEIKNGSNFNPSISMIEFRDRHCRLVKIYQENNNLVYEIGGRKLKLFDDNLVLLKNFQIFYDNPSGDPNFYFGTANKIFIFNYQVDFKTKILTIPFEFKQAVAPSNSAFINNPCQ